MNVVESKRVFFGTACIGLLILPGCADTTPSEVGYTAVPVYEGSRLVEKDSMGARVGDSMASLVSITTYTWQFETDATLKELEAFYRSKYPEAEFEQYEAEEPTELAGEDEGYDGDYDEEYIDEDRSSTTVWIDPPDQSVDELTIEVYDGGFVIAETLYD